MDGLDLPSNVLQLPLWIKFPSFANLKNHCRTRTGVIWESGAVFHRFLLTKAHTVRFLQIAAGLPRFYDLMKRKHVAGGVHEPPPWPGSWSGEIYKADPSCRIRSMAPRF